MLCDTLFESDSDRMLTDRQRSRGGQKIPENDHKRGCSYGLRTL
jgi:hypothetical protein